MIDQDVIEACDDINCRWKCQCARGIVWREKAPGVEIPMHRGMGGPQCIDFIDARRMEIEG